MAQALSQCSHIRSAMHPWCPPRSHPRTLPQQPAPLPCMRTRWSNCNVSCTKPCRSAASQRQRYCICSNHTNWRAITLYTQLAELRQRVASLTAALQAKQEPLAEPTMVCVLYDVGTESSTPTCMPPQVPQVPTAAVAPPRPMRQSPAASPTAPCTQQPSASTPLQLWQTPWRVGYDASVAPHTSGSVLVGLLLSLCGPAMLQLMGMHSPCDVDVHPTSVQQVCRVVVMLLQPLHSAHTHDHQ